MTAPTLVLSGRTTVRRLMALIKQCRLFITNDTGPMHIATAFGVPTVAIFGPTDPATTSPFGSRHELVRHPVDCSPCLLRECPIDHRCMQGISVEMVHAAAMRQTGTRSASENESVPVVYLDRDGTLNFDPGYLNEPEQLRLLPGVGPAVARLNRAGFKTVVLSNQSGVARGLITQNQLEAIHQRLRELLAEDGAWLTAALAFIPARETGLADELPGGRIAAVTSFITHQFVHGDLAHLGINSAWLLAFGTPVARRTDAARFVVFFLLAGTAGALLYLAVNGAVVILVVGASGAISAGQPPP